MRMQKLTLKGITCFEDEVAVDFTDLGPGLIAVAGKNGNGKTTLLEAAAAGLHLEYPTRPGGLHQVCHGKDAKIELEFVNGASYRALVAVDSVLKQPKTEAYLFNGDGSPITDGKVSTYQAEVEKRFGTKRLMLAAALSAQTRRGSFMELSRAERKDLLAEILDTAGLQALTEAAREKAKASERQLEVLRDRIATAEAELQRLADSELDTTALTEGKQLREARIDELQTALEAAREEYTRIAERHAVALSEAQELAARRRELEEIEAELADLRKRAGENIDAELQAARQRHATVTVECRELTCNFDDYREACEQLQAARSRIGAREETIRRTEGEAEEAAATLERLQKEVPSIERIEHQLRQAEQSAALLGDVPCGGEGKFAACQLLNQAQEARNVVPSLQQDLEQAKLAQARVFGAKQRLDDVKTTLRTLRDELDGMREEERRLQPVAAKLPLAESAAGRLADADQALQEAERSVAGRRAEYERQIGVQEAKLERLRQVVEATQAVDVGEIAREKEAAAEKGRQLRADLETEQKALREIVEAIAAAEAEAKRRTELRQAIATHHKEASETAAALADWRLLERAMGRDGIQALEIDAAGPELSDLTNDLLRATFGARFEVRFVTQALKRDGGMKEIFDVTVTDHERGREGSVDSLSGGEKTILSEAISLALAIYVRNHCDRRYETLWRDETAGQLDPENADRYIQMLRRARELSGAHHLIFIAQQPEVVAQADAVLWCENGRVEVRQ